MNVLTAGVALRERSLLDVLDLALRFLVVNARAYLVVSALTVLPAGLLAYAIAQSAGWAWAWTFSAGAALLVHAPITALASRRVFEPGARVRDAMGTATRALPRLFAARLVQTLSILAGALALLVAAFWVASVCWFLGEIVLLERAGAGQALSRSQRLVSGRTGDALLGLLLLMSLHVGLVFLADVGGRELIGGLLQFEEPSTMLDDGGSALALLGFWGAVPYVATARLFVYLDFRTRSEGWDIQARFAALRARMLAEEADA